ncbi:hypothetical protein VKT23_009883 [Stygiomarasmius scandens]|uniref:Uncharacterized protein n=1 Tax=Marasmiellus scandens TaxID=2682957 RepID=A0ABR1JDJ8_9AGAR
MSHLSGNKTTHLAKRATNHTHIGRTVCVGVARDDDTALLGESNLGASGGGEYEKGGYAPDGEHLDLGVGEGVSGREYSWN